MSLAVFSVFSGPLNSSACVAVDRTMCALPLVSRSQSLSCVSCQVLAADTNSVGRSRGSDTLYAACSLHAHLLRFSSSKSSSGWPELVVPVDDKMVAFSSTLLLSGQRLSSKTSPAHVETGEERECCCTMWHAITPPNDQPPSQMLSAPYFLPTCSGTLLSER